MSSYAGTCDKLFELAVSDRQTTMWTRTHRQKNMNIYINPRLANEQIFSHTKINAAILTRSVNPSNSSLAWLNMFSSRSDHIIHFDMRRVQTCSNLISWALCLPFSASRLGEVALQAALGTSAHVAIQRRKEIANSRTIHFYYLRIPKTRTLLERPLREKRKGWNPGNQQIYWYLNAMSKHVRRHRCKSAPPCNDFASSKTCLRPLDNRKLSRHDRFENKTTHIALPIDSPRPLQITHSAAIFCANLSTNFLLSGFQRHIVWPVNPNRSMEKKHCMIKDYLWMPAILSASNFSRVSSKLPSSAATCGHGCKGAAWLSMTHPAIPSHNVQLEKHSKHVQDLSCDLQLPCRQCLQNQPCRPTLTHMFGLLRTIRTWKAFACNTKCSQEPCMVNNMQEPNSIRFVVSFRESADIRQA